MEKFPPLIGTDMQHRPQSYSDASSNSNFEVASGSILEHDFGPNPKSYFTTSYPHPLSQAHPEDRRSREWLNMPNSLNSELLKIDRNQRRSGNPVYVMNLSTFSPANAAPWKNGNPSNHLWFIYYQARGAARAANEWNLENVFDVLDTHPHLGKRIRSIGGHLSCLVMGPPKGDTPDSFFIRSTDGHSTWKYRWHGLPEDCEDAVQSYIQGQSQRRDKRVDDKHVDLWMGGRIRAVTLGYNGAWISYRGEEPKSFNWGGDLPKVLEQALKDGKEAEKSINKVCLNPKNPNEYVLAFNDGEVYYSLHKDYVSQFKKVAAEWADAKWVDGEKVRLSFPSPQALDDEHCEHPKELPEMDGTK